MEAEYKQERLQLPGSAVTTVDGGEELSQASTLDLETAMSVIDLVARRADNRQDGRLDIVVILEEWATVDDDYPTVTTIGRVLLVHKVIDYSEKAYKFRGSFAIREEALSKGAQEFAETPATSLVEMIDQTDGEFAEIVGELFAPKSAVQGIYEVV